MVTNFYQTKSFRYPTYSTDTCQDRSCRGRGDGWRHGACFHPEIHYTVPLAQVPVKHAFIFLHLTSFMLTNICRVGVRRTGPDSVQWCPATGQGATGTNWSRGSSSWRWGRTSSLWGWRSPGTGCPGRLWSLLLWRYSRPAWTRCCTACAGWPFFGRGLGWVTPEVPSNPDHSVILWSFHNQMASNSKWRTTLWPCRDEDVPCRGGNLFGVRFF